MRCKTAWPGMVVVVLWSLGLGWQTVLCLFAVAYKLSKISRNDEILSMLHSLLFHKRAKVCHFPFPRYTFCVCCSNCCLQETHWISCSQWCPEPLPLVILFSVVFWTSSVDILFSVVSWMSPVDILFSVVSCWTSPVDIFFSVAFQTSPVNILLSVVSWTSPVDILFSVVSWTSPVDILFSVMSDIQVVCIHRLS